MGKTYSKEETIIAQTASGGNNNASVEQLESYVHGTNIVLIIIAVILLLGFIVAIIYFYRKCHLNWMREELRRDAIQRVVTRSSTRKDRKEDV